MLNGLQRFAHALSMDETVALADALGRAVTTHASRPETLALVDALTSALTIVTRESIVLTDGLAASLITSAALRETLAFTLRLPLGNTDYELWVMNADTLGVTQYTQLPFQSLATFAGRTFGVMETGLYALEGDDDDGDPIPARFRTGLLDLGTPNHKRLLRGYLYLMSDKDVILKTITDQFGERKAIWYRLTAKPSGHLQERRVKLGRGVQARSWSIEVANVDGADLDVRDMQVLPVVLKSRV